jgi:hypothetical protein
MIKMREKFTTTLTKDHKRKLAILAANNDSDKNEWIEKMVDIEWGKYINEMGNKDNRTK